MPRYCPTCNRSSLEAKFYGHFCEECTEKKFSEGLKDKAEIIRCKECGRIRVKGQFIYEAGISLEKALQHLFPKQIIHLISYDQKEALLDIAEETHDGRLSVEKVVRIRYEKVLCDRCYKIKCNYYEALFQLRGDPAKISKMIKYATSYFERHGEFVAKMENKDNGIDMYLSNKVLANEFVAYYKLYPKMSYILAGQRGGKKVYKNIYAIHL